MGFGMREFEEFLQYLGFWLIGESGSHTSTITSASVCTVRVFARPLRVWRMHCQAARWHREQSKLRGNGQPFATLRLKVQGGC